MKLNLKHHKNWAMNYMWRPETHYIKQWSVQPSYSHIMTSNFTKLDLTKFYTTFKKKTIKNILTN